MGVVLVVKSLRCSRWNAFLGFPAHVFGRFRFYGFHLDHYMLTLGRWCGMPDAGNKNADPLHECAQRTGCGGVRRPCTLRVQHPHGVSFYVLTPGLKTVFTMAVTVVRVHRPRVHIDVRICFHPKPILFAYALGFLLNLHYSLRAWQSRSV